MTPMPKDRGRRGVGWGGGEEGERERTNVREGGREGGREEDSLLY